MMIYKSHEHLFSNFHIFPPDAVRISAHLHKGLLADINFLNYPRLIS